MSRRALGRLLGIAALAFSGHMAAADGVEVLGGEHRDFTRLVLYLDADSDWRLTPSADGYRLDLGGPPASFDLSETFDRIPRSRIRAVDAVDGGLDIVLGCACRADAFRLRDLLVIDVRAGVPDPPRDEAPPRELARDPVAEISPPVRQGGRGSDRTASAVTRALDYIPFDAPLPPPPSESPPGTARQALTQAAPADGRRGGPPGAPETPETPPHLNRPAETAVPQDLAAVAERLADFAAMRYGAKDQTPAEPDAADAPADGRSREPLDHVAIRDVTGADPFSDDATCIADARLDLAAWGAEGGTDSGGATTALARSLLHRGFGVEAQRIVQTGGASIEDGAVLSALGGLIDELPAREPALFAGMIACPGRAALWALLGGDGTARDTVNGPAILTAFEELPEPVRRQIGPRLVDRLIDVGDIGSARILRRSLGRTPGLEPADGDIADLRLDLAGDRPRDDVPEEALRDRSAALTAVLAVGRDLLAREATVPDEIAKTARALAPEHRGTAVYGELASIALRHRTQSGDWVRALAETRAERDEAVRERLSAEIWQAAIASANDAEFLALTLNELEETTFAALPSETRSGIAARMGALGASAPFLAENDATGVVAASDPEAGEPAGGGFGALYRRSSEAVDRSQAMRERIGAALDALELP